jgi:hypothetical protein
MNEYEKTWQSPALAEHRLLGRTVRAQAPPARVAPLRLPAISDGGSMTIFRIDSHSNVIGPSTLGLDFARIAARQSVCIAHNTIEQGNAIRFRRQSPRRHVSPLGPPWPHSHESRAKPLILKMTSSHEKAEFAPLRHLQRPAACIAKD